MKHITTKTRLARAAMMLLGKQSRTADCRRSVTGRLLLLFLLLFTFLGGARAQTVTIGEGTSAHNSAPIANYYNYSIAEMLFTADEIGTTDANTILSLGFEGAGSCSMTYGITVYMKNVDAQSFTANTDYIQVSENDVVFTGSIKPAAGWNTIDLDTPFAYDNTKSLLVVVNKTSKTFDGSTSIWKYTSTSSTYKMLYSQNDNNGYDATTLTSASLNYERPNVQLTFGVPPTCFQPKNLQATLTQGNGTVATLTWNRHPSGTEDAWILQYGEDNTFATGTYTELTNGFTVATAINVTTVTANLSGLTAEHTYYARVKPECDTDGTLWSEVIRFKPSNAFCYEIGTGTSTAYLVSTSYGCTYSQHIYTADELTDKGFVAGDIVSVSFYYSGTSSTYDKTQSIYMGTTTKSSYSGSAASDFESDVTLVYGPTLLSYVAGWREYELTEPFTWDGASNIVVGMLTNSTQSYSSGWSAYGSSTSPDYRTIYRYRDNNPIDITDLASVSNGYRSNTRPNISLSIMATNTPKPRNLEFSDITSSGATMTWSAPATGTPTGYEYQYKLATDQWPATWTSNGTNLYVPVSGLTAGTDYVFRVRATYTEGESDPIETQFTTLDECAFPTGLAATPVPGNGTMATLSWTKGYDETEWVLQYGTDDTFATYTEKTDGFNTQDDPVITCDLTGLTAETTYYARVKAKCSATSSSSWSNVVEFVPTNFVDYTYNDGATSSYYFHPFYGLYTNNATNQSQFVIPAEELAEIVGCTIRSITYYTSSTTTTDWGGVIFDVYMAEVENSTFSNATFIDWETLNNVYTGTVSLSNGMMTIAFDQNYTYNGGNLLIGFKTNTVGAATQGISWTASYSSSQNNVVYQYGSNSASRTGYFPKITFSYLPTPYKYPVIDEANCTYMTTSAHIAWTVTGATPTGYQYQYKTISGDWPANWSSTTDAYADLSSLTHSTYYDFRVKALYDGGHESIVVNYRFATECDVITTFPITYGFETTEGFPASAPTPTTNLFGACWRNEVTVQTGSNANRVWGTSTNTYHDGSQALILPDKGSSSSTETDCAKTMLVFPAMEFTAPSGYIVSFWIYRSGTNSNPEGFKMYISDCEDIGSNAVELGHYSRNYGQPYPVVESASGWYQYQTAPITTMTGTVYLIFEGQSYYGNPTYVDDITIDVTPTCWQPQNLVANNVTNEAATLTWERHPYGDETAWVLQYGEDNTFATGTYTELTDGFTVTTVNDVTTVTANLTSLSAEHTYYARVKPACDTEGNLWSEVITFTTEVACPAPTMQPVSGITNNEATISWTGSEAGSFNVRYRKEAEPTFFEDFEDGLTGWTTIDADGDGYNWELGSVLQAGYAPYSYDGNDWVASQSYSGSALTPDNYLITPQVQLGGMIRFYASPQDDDDLAEHIGIAVSTTNNTSTDAFTTIWEYTMTENAYKEFTVDLSAYAGQTGYVAIRHFNCTDQFYLNVDNFGIYAADAWQTPADSPVSTNSITITGLDAETTYEVQVQAVCGGEDGESAWVSTTFTTVSNDAVPYDLSSTQTSTTATLSWVGAQDSYNLRYRKLDAGEKVTTTENFSGQTAVGYNSSDGELPTGWYSYTTGTDAPRVSNSSNYSFISALTENYLLMTTTDTGQSAYAIMPQYSDITEVSFNYAFESASSCGNLEVGYVTDNTDYSTFTRVGEPIAPANSSSHSYTLSSADIATINSNNGYIAFKYNSNSGTYYSAAIDDVVVTTQSFTSGAWNTDNTNVTSGLTINSLETNTKYEWQVQGISSKCDGGVTEWSASAYFTTLANIDLANDATNNASTINSNDGVCANVTLTDRELFRDGYWNTLYLPFSVALTGSPLAGAEARYLSSATISGTTLNLTFSDPVNLLEAGVPYIIKWNVTETTEPLAEEDLVFNNVIVYDTDKSYDNGETGDDRVRFIGTYDKVTFPNVDKSILFMGAENMLYYPDGTNGGVTIGACRAYFKIGEDGGAPARQLTGFNLNFGDGSEETGIISKESRSQGVAGAWYSLDGVKLDGKPTRKGLYIHGGRKVAIK